MLDEKWYQQSADWNSGGSCWIAYDSIACWSERSPSQAMLSMSIIHHWRGIVVKYSNLRGTGLHWSSVGDPLMTVCVGSFSSLCSNADRPLRSDIGSSNKLNSLPVEKGCGVISSPLKLLTRAWPVADVRTVITSPICIPFQTWSEILNMETKKYQ